MKLQTSNPLFIQAPAMVRALASPARQEIIDALVAAGPCSIAELAAHTGRAPDSLYFHIRRLVKVGLVLERNPRKSGRHVAAIYDLPGRPVFIRYKDAPPRALQAVLASALRLGARDFADALRSPHTVTEGDARTLWGGRVKGWVDHDDLLRINALIRELYETIRSARPGPGRHPQTFSFSFAPVHPTRRAARPSSRRAARPATHAVSRKDAEPEPRLRGEGSDPSHPSRPSVNGRARSRSASRSRPASHVRAASRTPKGVRS